MCNSCCRCSVVEALDNSHDTDHAFVHPCCPLYSPDDRGPHELHSAKQPLSPCCRHRSHDYHTNIMPAKQSECRHQHSHGKGEMHPLTSDHTYEHGKCAGRICCDRGQQQHRPQSNTCDQKTCERSKSSIARAVDRLFHHRYYQNDRDIDDLDLVYKLLRLILDESNRTGPALRVNSRAQDHDDPVHAALLEAVSRIASKEPQKHGCLSHQRSQQDLLQKLLNDLEAEELAAHEHEMDCVWAILKNSCRICPNIPTHGHLHGRCRGSVLSTRLDTSFMNGRHEFIATSGARGHPTSTKCLDHNKGSVGHCGRRVFHHHHTADIARDPLVLASGALRLPPLPKTTTAQRIGKARPLTGIGGLWC